MENCLSHAIFLEAWAIPLQSSLVFEMKYVQMVRTDWKSTPDKLEAEAEKLW